MRTEQKGRERWENPLGVGWRAFMYCLNIGEGRRKEELKINLRMVNFSLAEISSMGRGTNFRQGQCLWGKYRI